MKIFKFGGASVKDAKGVIRLADVLNNEGVEDTVVIISAMGKMTNAFEKVVDAYLDPNENLTLNFVKNYHRNILAELFSNENHKVYNKVDLLFSKIGKFY